MTEGEAERKREPEDREECCEIVPGNDKAVAFKNSLQLWLTVQDMDKTIPAKILA